MLPIRCQQSARRTSMKALVIVVGIASIAMLTFTPSSFAQTVEKAKPLMDKAKAQGLFDQAKIRYEAYEHEHSGWIQTKNVKMHYLQWKNPTGTPLMWAIGTYSSAYEMAPFAERFTGSLQLIIMDTAKPQSRSTTFRSTTSPTTWPR